LIRPDWNAVPARVQTKAWTRHACQYEWEADGVEPQEEGANL